MIRAAGTVLWRYAGAGGVAGVGGSADAESSHDAAAGGASAGGARGIRGAAGAYGMGEPWEFALIHRPKYVDWSLPKGKVHRGEELWLAAIRETAEETGCDAVLGPPLGHTRYRTSKGKKRVDWWLARAGDEGNRAVASRPRELRGRIAREDKRIRDAQAGKIEEIDELIWLAGRQALALLSYESDRKVLARAIVMLRTGEGQQPAADAAQP